MKQALRCWSEKFRKFLRQFDFREGEADKCIFHGRVESTDVYLALFVDDGFITSDSHRALESIVTSLRNAFEITIGDGHIFVGIQIERNRVEKTLFIHQEAYTKRIINKFKMSDAKASAAPADPNVRLTSIDTSVEESIQVPFREAVGSLMFLAVVTRPDIVYAVNSVSKYLCNHSESHWQAVKRIYKYLVATTKTGIEYRSGGSTSALSGFSDADFASDTETRRSTTGFAFCFSKGIVS